MNNRTLVHSLYISLRTLAVASLTLPCSAQDLIISEYVEGSGNKKCIELYNPTSSSIDLAASNYKLVMYPNGSSSGQTKSNLTGTLLPGDVHVVCEAQSGIPSDQNFTAGPNGNDAITLEKNGGTIVDLFGNIGCDPGTSWSATGLSTKDRTLVRRPCITRGITSDNPASCPFSTLSSEWIGFPLDDLSNLGSHHDVIAIENVQSSDPTDCGLSDGTIDIIALGSALEYSINGGNDWQNTRSFYDLEAGLYDLVIRSTGSNSCSVIDQVVLEAKEYPALTNIITSHPTDCLEPSGALEIHAEGIDLEYSIDGGILWDNNPTFDQLEGGSFDVVVRTSGTQNCLVEQNVQLRQPSIPMITGLELTNPSDCGSDDGRIYITAAGEDLEYSIDGGTLWANNRAFDHLEGGSFDVVVRTSGTQNCLVEQNVQLHQPSIPMITELELTNPSDCGLDDGRIYITAAGEDLEYSIDGGQDWSHLGVFDGLAGGSYEILVRVRNTIQCLTSKLAEISTQEAPVIEDLLMRAPSDCQTNDGEIHITANGSNLTYSLDGANWRSENTFTNLPSDTYQVMVRSNDLPLCVDETTVVLQGPSDPIIHNLTVQEPTNCGVANGEIIIDAEGGNLEYSIDNGSHWQTSNVFANLSGGSYQSVIRVTGTQNCLREQTVFLKEPQLPSIALIDVTSPSDCGLEDGTILIEAVGDNPEYSIDGGEHWHQSGTFENLVSSFYQILIREENKSLCVVQEDIIMNTPSAPEIVSIQLEDPTDCEVDNGSISISALGSDLEYSLDGVFWQDEPNFKDLASHLYVVRVREKYFARCHAEITVHLEGAKNPQIIDINTKDPTDCGLSDGQLNIEAIGFDLEYSIDRGISWQTTSHFDDLQGGSYDVITRSKSFPQCRVEDQISLQQLLPPLIENIRTSNPSDCEVDDGVITIQASGQNLEYSIDEGYQWTTNPSFIHLNDGIYEIRVRTQGTLGCLAIENVRLYAPLKPAIESVQAQDPTDCETANGSISIVANGANLEFTIDGSVWYQSNTFSELTAGLYQVRVREQFTQHCTDQLDVILESPKSPVILSVDQNDPSGCGVADGSITIHSQGDNLEFSLDGGEHWQESRIFLCLAGGAFSIVAREKGSKLCQARTSVHLPAYEMPEITSLDLSHPSDCEKLDGTIQVL
ncbi:MAG: lamin tail domain-containing protein, partial [Saprospiraceae bacterium]|nr:lamin tail domain-containing protein [Saprospiraceae bacterium]